MEIIVIGFVIGIIAVVAWFFILFTASLLGIPIERRSTVEKRMAIAQQIQAERATAEAQRQLAVEAEKARLGG